MSAIEKFKSTARLERLDGLIASMKNVPTGSLPALTPQKIKLLLIVRKIERLVMVTYANEVKRMSSWNIPSIRSFSVDWEYEETRHAIAFEEYARIHGFIMPKLTAQGLGLKYRVKAYLIAKASHLFPVTGPAVHMIIGTINEVTAKNIYRALGECNDNDELLTNIVKAIEIEEVRHFNFYKNSAIELISNEKIRNRVERMIDFLWEPVGAGNDDVGIMAKILLAKEEAASHFFADVEKMLGTISDLVPKVSNRVIGDIQRLRAS